MKTVLITGASGNIGACVARAFAKLNYNLILTYNLSKGACVDLANELSSKCMVSIFKCDVSNQQEVEKLANFVNDKFKKVDILVNNAGVACTKLLTDHSAKDIENVINTNLIGAINLTRLLVPAMILAKAGCIINISSIWGVSGSSCESVYSASKAGLIGFTKALAKELGPSNITVNVVAPGVIDTKMNSNLTKDDIDLIIESTPLQALGTPTNVANAVLFLSNSNFITGQTLTVDGGLTI